MNAKAFAYDYNGNTQTMVNSAGTTTYAWDFENRLTSVVLPGSGGTVYLKYDPFGRRIYKSSSSGTSVYAYDGDNLVEETNGTGSVVARYSQGLNIDEPLAMLRSGTTSYYQADGLGSLTSLSNASGALASTYTYDSFGNLVASSGSLVNSFRYTGREFDTETGLYYYRARYYDPTAGRFISEDPITFTGGINFYRYVRNNPVNLVDPFGLNPAPSIPWPLPWFPPGSGVLGGLGNLVGGAVDVLGKAAIPITVIYKLTIGAKPMGIDDARAIPKPKPCDKDRDNHCEQIYEEDKAICLALPRKEQKAVCMRQAATRYGECLAKGEPSSPLSWW